MKTKLRGLFTSKKVGKKEKQRNLWQFIHDKAENGEIVVMTLEGLGSMNMDNFFCQPVDGMLYDLNRDEVTISTFLDDVKWVNDYAATLVIRRLCKMLAEVDPRFAHWKEKGRDE